ncbi:BA14K family protein [Pararhodobacter sp.]|uniref:BA14K family protein n=1 Tax=Pararhodobacter sp. TaxID=2127056 RepID=UPI002FDD9814
MKIFISTLCAAMLTLSPAAVGTASAASATPLALIGSGAKSSALDNLVEVQHRHRSQPNWRGNDRRGQDRRGYDNRGRWPQQHRPQRQRQQSSGPDLGSAIVGAIVGGVIVNQMQQSGQQQQQHYGHSGSYLSRNHVDWCHNRWRSYRVSDNSYQPYNGPRRVCMSPYGPN